MSRKTHLDLDDFPQSPYADELRKGISPRPFSAGIEAEYAAEHLERVRLRARLWFTLVAVATLPFALNQVQSEGLWHPVSLLHLGLLIPASTLMLYVVWTRYYERLFLRIAPVLVPVMTSGIVIFLAHLVANGKGQALSGMVTHVFAVFFFSGLMYRFAALTSAAIIGAFLVAAVPYQMPTELAVTGLLIMAISAVLAAIVNRGVEIAYRRAFLERILVRELTARDGLTGIMNRRAFDEHLLRVWQQGLRDKRSLAVLMIDIDYFKSYNDFHGHQAGDSALRQTAQVIQGFARRPLDAAARYGGEEFVVVLYDLQHEQLAAIAERLRKAVEDLHVRHGAPGAGDFVTVSVGVGIMEPSIGRTPQGAVQFADEALYLAKEAGRNRVIVRGGEEYQSLKTGAFSNPRTIRLQH